MGVILYAFLLTSTRLEIMMSRGLRQAIWCPVPIIPHHSTDDSIPSRCVPLARRPYAGRLRSGALLAGRLGGRIQATYFRDRNTRPVRGFAT